MTEEQTEMVEVCGCGVNSGKPVDLDGDGIAEWCILCGQYFVLTAAPAEVRF